MEPALKLVYWFIYQQTPKLDKGYGRESSWGPGLCSSNKSGFSTKGKRKKRSTQRKKKQRFGTNLFWCQKRETARTLTKKWCKYTYIHIYIYIYVCMYACLCICEKIYIRIHIYIPTRTLIHALTQTHTRQLDWLLQHWGGWTQRKIRPSPHMGVSSEFSGIPLNPQDNVRARSTEKRSRVKLVRYLVDRILNRYVSLQKFVRYACAKIFNEPAKMHS